jgi:hypothetical protein
MTGILWSHEPAKLSPTRLKQLPLTRRLLSMLMARHATVAARLVRGSCFRRVGLVRATMSSYLFANYREAEQAQWNFQLINSRYHQPCWFDGLAEG